MEEDSKKMSERVDVEPHWWRAGILLPGDEGCWAGKGTEGVG